MSKTGYNEHSTKQTPLVEAIEIAQVCKDALIPFSYNDVGLKNYRWYRRPFRKWAEENQIEFRLHTHTSGKRGSQHALFYPFRIDEDGNKILAPSPSTEET